MFISVVIPNFNSASLLEKNLPRLFKLLEHSELGYEVVVADDASTDDSLTVLASFARGGLAKLAVKLSEGAKNQGFASTVDRGIRVARGEIVFTLKTDSLPKSPQYFKLMLNHFGFNYHFGKRSPAPDGTGRGAFSSGAVQNDTRRVFAVSAALETTENGKTEIRGRGEIYFEKGFFLHRRGPGGFHPVGQGGTLSAVSAWADGGASAFRRDLYLKLGGFDKLYNPFYWEDVDLGYRAWKAGYKIIFEPKAVLIHTHELGAIRRHYNPSQIKTISLRNQFIFVWKNADLKHLLLYCFWEPYHGLIALKTRDILWFRAYWQAVFKLPQIFLQRLRQEKSSFFSDDQMTRFFLVKSF